MRPVVFSAACSLDGFIAREDGSYDWIPEEPQIDWNLFMNRFDTVLMGRHSYLAAREQQQGEFMGGKQVIVFSKTLRRADHPGVTILSDYGAGSVEKLRSQVGDAIWLFGGGVLFQHLLASRQVDRIELAIVPVLLGRGVPLLPLPAPSLELTLSDVGRYPSGLVQLNYDLKRLD